MARTSAPQKQALLARAGLVLLALFLLYRLVSITGEYWGIVRMPFLPHIGDFGGSDFSAFYGGAQLFVDDPANAYDPVEQTRVINRTKHLPEGADFPWNRYYNPPAYSLILAPLTLLTLTGAFKVTLLLNLVGLVFLMWVLKRILRERPLAFWLLAAGLVSFQPVVYAFWHGQATLYLAALLGCVYLAAESKRWRQSGLLWVLLGLKPHWLLSPPAGVKALSRSLLVALAAGLLVMALPFLIVGADGTMDYIRLLMGRGRGDVADESFSEGALSWWGFFRGLNGEPNLLPALGMALVTIACFAYVRLRGKSDLWPAASVSALLMVMPHSHPQDWIMLAPAVAILMRSQTSLASSAVVAVLLIGMHVGMDEWSQRGGAIHVIYWPTLVAFALLVWTFLLAESQRRAARENDPDSDEAQTLRVRPNAGSAS